MVIVSALVSSLHLLALAIGLPATASRARALRGPLDDVGLRRVLAADTAWGVAAFLWLATGPPRAFSRLEKGAEFYLSSPLFLLKMGLFLLVFALEVAPMVGLIRWRIARGRGRAPDTRRARAWATLSAVQAAVVVLIVFVAGLMARGVGRAP